jgi:hypothetical protein
MAVHYALQSKSDGKSCKNPWSASYHQDPEGVGGNTYGNTAQTGLRRKYSSNTVTLRWHVHSGYALCRVEIKQAGKPVFVSRAVSGKHAFNLRAFLEYAYVTARKR